MTGLHHKDIGPREGATPGPRTRVTLDVGEVSLPILLAGVDCTRCWLTDEGDHYVFHATSPMGVLRRMPGVPAADLLTDLLNDLDALMDTSRVPQDIRDERDRLVDAYLAKTKPDTTPSKDDE